jgi:hypothetical protein
VTSRVRKDDVVEICFLCVESVAFGSLQLGPKHIKPVCALNSV